MVFPVGQLEDDYQSKASFDTDQTNDNGCGAGVLFFSISLNLSFRESGHATELSLSILQRSLPWFVPRARLISRQPKSVIDRRVLPS
jgi:hypothetical protein